MNIMDSVKLTLRSTKHMKKHTKKQIAQQMIALLAVSFMVSAHAALPPQYQNAKDLNAMVSFAKQHKLVISSLHSINMTNKTITYNYFDGKKNNICLARFTRKAVSFKGPGPAGDLIFDKSDCPLTWKKP